jgi:hypothetical protein
MWPEKNDRRHVMQGRGFAPGLAMPSREISVHIALGERPSATPISSIDGFGDAKYMYASRSLSASDQELPEFGIITPSLWP